VWFLLIEASVATFRASGVEVTVHQKSRAFQVSRLRSYSFDLISCVLAVVLPASGYPLRVIRC